MSAILIRKTVAVSLVLFILGCSPEPRHDDHLVLRVAELQDSLMAYRDSLKDVQRIWSFNSISSLVKLQSHEINLGDSCRVEIFIGAGNSLDAGSLGYRYGDERLEIDEIYDTRITKDGMRWIVAFKPSKVGLDSLKGKVLVGDVDGDQTELLFAAPYKVTKQ